ncbi:enoyl-CoA hydratase/isomerase family protein [Roseovarius spongiae]|uniref:Enoyl-CoA hydratase/isomerase family protein n=1 Tax=Roseovarius spongiae TaxID=2320272 RepID=A0A3A8AS17_9RHOB|nr:enoyl-CoA hydratase/isomerase family protein [Roseovarius spongiae]RKF12952.1 enoyl-CoA hydratase/isomerase family protein [Roseovarius spongiae]
MIGLDKEGGVWTVRIDRRDKANALTAEMLTRLADIAEDAAEARVLILTGAGEVFSAGADLDAARAGLATSPDWERLSGAIAALPGLSIAALNGPVAGGALGMVLACDLRIATSETRIFYPVMKLGFLPQPSDPARLAALVGPARAKLILMAGQKIDAHTARAWGLVNALCARDALLPTAHALAADTLQAAPDHATAIKSMIP